MIRMLRKTVSSFRALAMVLWPFSGPPLDRGLSLLAKQACQTPELKQHFANQGGPAARLYCKLMTTGRFSREARMNEVVMLDGSEPIEILQTAIDHKIAAIMSYLSKGKWHVAKVLITAVDEDGMSVQPIHPYQKQHPINIKTAQPVGVSFKYEYGKYVFNTAVVSLEPAVDQKAGGKIVLSMPDQIEIVQRRSYFRVEVPESLKVNATLWHRKAVQETPKQVCQTPDDRATYFQGRLVDISAGGGQVVLDAKTAATAQFKKGQFITMRFTPLPYETPLLLSAQIRNMLPRAEGDSVYLGLQIVGLEASPEGRKVLARLVGVVERYFKMNEPRRKKAEKSCAATAAR